MKSHIKQDSDSDIDIWKTYEIMKGTNINRNNKPWLNRTKLMKKNDILGMNDKWHKMTEQKEKDDTDNEVKR